MIYVFFTKAGHRIETDGKTKDEALKRARAICKDMGVKEQLSET